MYPASVVHQHFDHFSTEAVRPKLLKFGIKHPQEGKPKMLFFVQIGYVAMATYTSHRLIMEKSGNCKLLSHWRYLNFIVYRNIY